MKGVIYLAIKLYAIVMMLGLVFLSVPAVAAEDADLQAKIDTYFSTYEKIGRFSGSVLVSRKGKILLSKGYGMADYEQNTPNTPETKFHLCSVSKQFTAMAIMMLEEKGKLKVSDPLAKYIPGFLEGKSITLHNLLTHTSGIPEYLNFPEFTDRSKGAIPLEEIIRLFNKKHLDFKPGKNFGYCNSDYLLLAYVIEKVSGQDYKTFLEENIFAPLGMKNTTVGNPGEASKGYAQGYIAGLKGARSRMDAIDLANVIGTGGIYSTVEDLYLWDRALYTEKLISKKSLDRMFTPFMVNPGSGVGYGYGFMTEKLFGHKVVFHSGTFTGFITQITRFTDDDITIIVLRNLQDREVMTDKLDNDIAAILFNRHYELPDVSGSQDSDAQNYAGLTGAYEVKAIGLTVEIADDSGSLYVVIPGQAPIKLQQDDELDFHGVTANLRITFTKDAAGMVNGLKAAMGGTNYAATKVEGQ